MGHKEDAKGLRYEQKVANYFTNKGWKLRFRVMKYGYEYDLYAVNSDILSGDEYLVVECKDKDLVTAKDVLRFIKKVHILYEHLPQSILSEPDLHAYICYSKKIDSDAADVVRRNKPRIKLLKI